MSIDTSSLKARIDGLKKITDVQEKQSEINGIVKAIKKCVKKEIFTDDLRRMEDILSYFQNISKELEGFPSTKLKMLGQQIQERCELLKNREAFSDPNELARFDLFLRQKNLAEETQKSLLAVVQKIQLKNEPITQKDLEFLSSMKTPVFQPFLSQLKTSIEASIKRRAALIDQVLPNGLHQTPQEKLKTYIILKQVLGNPLEFPVEPSLFENYNAAKDYLDSCEMEGVVKAGKIPYTEETLNYKIEGLKLIRAQALKEINETPGNRKKILISGFGPGGLTAGFLSMLQGHDVSIIEKRKEGQELRKNVLAIGKESSGQHLPMFQDIPKPGNYEEADLRLLDFLGVTDYLASKGLAKLTDNTKWQNIAIGDLQTAMLNGLQTTAGEEAAGALIQNETTISGIEKHENTTTVTLSNGTRQHYDTVIVMEGTKSSTRTMLGIDIHKHSKASRMALSYFKMIEAKPKASLESTAKSFHLFLKMVSLAFKILWYHRTSKNQLDLMFKIWGRGLIVLKTPHLDYGYANLTEAEERILKECESAKKEAEASRDEWADNILKILSDFKSDSSNEQDSLSEQKKTSLEYLLNAFKRENRNEWFNNEEEMDAVFTRLREVMQVDSALTNNEDFTIKTQFKEIARQLSELEKSTKDEEEAIKEAARSGMPTMNVIMNHLYRLGERTPELIDTFFATSQITQAEKSVKRVGSTTFFLGGDAASTTDPMSGSGARTTMLGVAIALPLLNSPFGNSNLGVSLCEWSNNLRSRSMREEGFEMRSAFRESRMERYTEIGIDSGALSKEDARFVLKLNAQKKSGLPINPIFFSRLKTIKNYIKENYPNYPHFLRLEEDYRKDDIHDLIVRGCSQEEADVYYKVCKLLKAEGSEPHSQEETSLNENEKRLFWSAAAKIAESRFSLIEEEIRRLSTQEDEETIKTKLDLFHLSSGLSEQILHRWKTCKRKGKKFSLTSSLRKEIAILNRSRRAATDLYLSESWAAPLLLLVDDLLTPPTPVS